MMLTLLHSYSDWVHTFKFYVEKMLATEVACKHESIAKVFFVITYRGEEESMTL